LCLDRGFLGQNEGIGGAAFPFGGSEDKSASKPIQTFGQIQFYVVAGFEVLFPCWQSARD